MIQIMQKYLQENWVQIDDVIYIDFSELDNKNTDLIALYQSYTGRKPFFILDEIQELDNFESQVLFLYNE
jgi:predicted AAA+ superfamily ATPase